MALRLARVEESRSPHLRRLMIKRFLPHEEMMSIADATEGQSANIEEHLLRVARELYEQGPVMAQESLVLRRVAAEMNALKDIRKQQAILTYWHQLFHSNKLAWGYDIDNPGPPFFHFPNWIDHVELPDWTDTNRS